jgi:hypothetical protein
MPSTATTREGVIREGMNPSAFAPALPLTPPTPSPGGEVFSMGIARSRCGHPRIRELGSTDAFFTRWTSRAWD